MADRRRKPKTLSLPQQADFIEAASRLHDVCCGPRIDISSEHHRALTDLNQAICEAIERIFGKQPPWASTSNVWEEFDAKVKAFRDGEVARRARFGG